MSRSLILAITTAVVVIAAIIIAIAYSPGKKSYNWFETYDPLSKDPYGTFITAQLLKEKNKGKNFLILARESIKKYLEKNPNLTNTIYMVMGSSVFYSDKDVKALTDFVEKGNTVFMSLNYLPYDIANLEDNFKCADNSFQEYMTDSFADLSLINSTFSADTFFRYFYKYKNKNVNTTWTYIDSISFCDSSNRFAALGYIGNGYFNFIGMPHGKGMFYMHCTPFAFSNLSMLEDSHYKYFNNVMSYLPDANIIWDEYHKEFYSNESHAPGPLKFILENASLRWAWYLLLLSILLFVIFFGKRRQKVIPVVTPYENTTVEYVDTITELYFRQKDNKSIAQHKMRLFQSFIRGKYYFHSIHPTEDFFIKLSLKSGIQTDHIKNIFATYQLMEQRTDVTDGDLINFHSLIEYFYNHSK